MKLTTRGRISVTLLIIAAIVSIGGFQSKSYNQVAPCYNTPACQNNMMGTLKVVKMGFPAAYRQTASYKPTVTSTFANASVEQQGLSMPIIIADIIFCYALLDELYRVYVWIRTRGKTNKPASSEKSSQEDHQDTSATTPQQ